MEPRPRRSHTRSRSPREHRHPDPHRSRSPHKRRSHHRHHHSHDRERERERERKARLPFRSAHLHKRDFESYQPLFAEYLDVQKGKEIRALDADEVRGRWKSFVGKWNRGELAEGWYDPDTKERVDSRWDEKDTQRPSIGQAQEGRIAAPEHAPYSKDEDDEDDDGYGPALPGRTDGLKRGPTAPGMEDLQHKRELADEEREAHMADLRHERKQDRSIQKERLDELVPRADPGSRERQLEKKREVSSTNRAFADAKEAGAEEVGDSELMGDDGAEGYRKRKMVAEKKKNERELRKEEVLRARAVEREERLRASRKKEEKTMEMLKALAQERFGAGG